MKKIDTVIFDLDGTLLNTLDDLTDAVNYAMKECGYPERKKEEVRTFIGGGAKTLIYSSVPEQTSEQEKEYCKEIFLEYYVKHSNVKTDLYKGIRPLVHDLYKNGYKLGVVSSKGDRAVKDLIFNYFKEEIQIAIGETPGILKKTAPDSILKAMEELGGNREHTIYIGDSEVDIETANNTGIPCIIVTWGFRDREDLEKLLPDYIVDRPEEIINILGY